jgi:predicted ribosome quality control (RQC) complex YloA/Tae2 family protein
MNAGAQVVLTVDATVGPVEHAQKLYKRAAKQRRAIAQLEPLIEQAKEQLQYLSEVEESLHELRRQALSSEQHQH